MPKKKKKVIVILSKGETLTLKIGEFEKSERNVKDYAGLALAFYIALRPDNGLPWSQLEEAISNAINKPVVSSLLEKSED